MDRRRPTSICARDGGDQPGVRCGERFSSYEELFTGALRATSGLPTLGVGAGDRVALLLRNSIEFLQASVATVPLGASAVPINWHWRGEEVSHVLSDSRAKVLVVHDDLWPAGGRRRSRGAGGGARVQPRDAARGALRRSIDGRRLESWPQWLAAHEPWSQAPESGPVSIIYTSGTTGRPKGVVRTPVDRGAASAGLGADRRDVPAARRASGR